MATARELDILAREALHFIDNEHIPQTIAIMTVLNAHKDIKWCDGIKRDIGTRISQIRKAERQKKASKGKSAYPFPTFAEKSFKDN